ncbi:hypothetical protein U1Q18_033821 [Sarracenia purpurea var. burkii]
MHGTSRTEKNSNHVTSRPQNSSNIANSGEEKQIIPFSPNKVFIYVEGVFYLREMEVVANSGARRMAARWKRRCTAAERLLAEKMQGGSGGGGGGNQPRATVVL